MIAEAAAIAEKDAKERGAANQPGDATSGFDEEKDDDIIFWEDVKIIALSEITPIIRV